MLLRSLSMRPLLALAWIPSFNRDTTAPNNVIESDGPWSFLSDVLNPRSSHSCLNAQNLDFDSLALSAQYTSSANAPTTICRRRNARNCMKVTTRPQFAGDLRLPNGCARILALYGLLSFGLMKQMYGASDESGWRAIVLYACEKSSDQARKWCDPCSFRRRESATKESRS